MGAYTFAALLIGLGLLASADIAGWLFPQAVHYFALATLVVGAGLLVGTWFGRSRGLILLGVALLFPLAGSFAVANADQIFDGWAWDQEFSARTIVIDDVSGIERIEVGAGDITIDAREAEWTVGPSGADAGLIIDAGAAELTLQLPDDVDVTANLGVGTIIHDGDTVREGLGLSFSSGNGTGPFVHVDQGVGEIRIEGGER